MSGPERISSDGTEERPHCSWYSSCTWDSHSQADCANALCKASGYMSGSFVSASNNMCTSGNVTGSAVYYEIDTGNTLMLDKKCDARITADCQPWNASTTHAQMQLGTGSIVVSDGTAARPFCSWLNHCSWDDQTKLQCAEALCTASGFEAGGYFVSASNSMCTSDFSIGTFWYFEADTSRFVQVDKHTDAQITAACTRATTTLKPAASASGLTSPASKQEGQSPALVIPVLSVLCFLVGGLMMVAFAVKRNRSKSKLQHQQEDKRTDHEDLELPKPRLLGSRFVAYLNRSFSKSWPEKRPLGVSLDYLQRIFPEEARLATGLQNPSFYVTCPVYASGPHGKGAKLICPRDGQLGCSVIDVLEPHQKSAATHFVSWSWGYSLEVFVTALQGWAETSKVDIHKTFLWICFFCNNQYRIKSDMQATSPEALQATFELNLLRTGRMLLLLDDFEQPVYATRSWCVFESFVCIDRNIPMTIILPQQANRRFQDALETNPRAIRDGLSNLDVRKATASCQADDDLIKRAILNSHGFDAVNRVVQKGLARWLTQSFADYIAVDSIDSLPAV